jgi:WD40 repeat protein
MAHPYFPLKLSRLQVRTVLLFAFFALLFAPISAFSGQTNIERPELVVQTGHTAVTLTSVTSSANGRWVASGGSDGRVKIWNLETAREVRTLGSQQESISAVAFSSDGTYIAFAGGKFLVVSEILSGKEVANIPTDTLNVPAVAFTPDRQWLAWADGPNGKLLKLPQDLNLWDRSAMESIRSLPSLPHSALITALAFSNKSQWLSLGNAKGDVVLWDLIGESGTHQMIGNTSSVASISFAPDDRLLGAATSNNLLLWDLNSKARPRIIQHSKQVHSVRFTSATRVVSASADPVDTTLRVSTWNTETGDLISSTTIATQISPFLFEYMGRWPIVFAPSANFLAFASDFRTIKIWNFQADSVPVELSGVTARIQAVATDRRKRWIAIGSGSNIQLWNLADGEESLLITGYKKAIHSLEFSNDGNSLVSTSEGSEADVWDVNTRKSTIHRHGNFSSLFGDSAHMAAATQNGCVSIWDIPAKPGTEASIVGASTRFGIDRIAVSRDGSLLSTASQLSSEVKVWRVNGGDPIRTVSKSGFHRLTDLRFSPDGQYLVWGTTNGMVAVLNISSGRELLLCCHGIHWAGAIAISEDGRLLVSGGTDNQIKIWNLPNAWAGQTQETSTLTGHTGAIRSLALSPDGRLLVSGSEDGTARIWDMGTGRERADLVSMSDNPGWLVVTPDGLFDGTADAIKRVSWRSPHTNDIFPLDAFYNDYFHPGLPAEIFEGGHPAPRTDIAALLRVPGVRTMQQQRLLHIEVHNDKAMLCLPDKPDRSLFDGVDSRIRGLPVAVDTSSFHSRPGESCQYALDLPGTPDEIEFNMRRSPASQNDKSGRVQSSPKHQCASDPRGKLRASVLHIQTVAIGAYPPSSGYHNLTSPVGDATRLEDFFSKRLPSTADSYEGVRVWKGLCDSSANLTAIRLRFAAMAKEVKEDDIVLLFLSGHGRVPPGQEMFYFLPVDGKKDMEFSTAVSTALLADFVRSLPARRIILLIDACQSGGALDSLAQIASAKTAANRRSATAIDVSGLPPKQAGTYVIAASIPFQAAIASSGRSVSGRNVCAQDLASHISDDLSKLLENLTENQLPLTFSQGTNFVIVGK